MLLRFPILLLPFPLLLLVSVSRGSPHTTVTVGQVVARVDERYVSYLVDTASLELDATPCPSYPYPVNFSSPLLRKLLKPLSPAFFVMNSGMNNCLRYNFTSPAAAPADPPYVSDYCRGKQYYGVLSAALFDTILDFANATGAAFVWHFNMADGRGYTPHYVPWDPRPAASLLQHVRSTNQALAGVMLFEEVKSSKLGFEPTPAQLGQDLALLAGLAANSTPRPLVYGVLDQDSDQAPQYTDAAYQQSAASVDVVCFSYYQNNAAQTGACPVDPAATAAFMFNPAYRRQLDTNCQHYVRLSKELGKGPPHLTAGAPCTHAPEGTGWGAVNRFAGALWYADALGRVARNGVAVFARQTAIGGDYGLLDNTTSLPTPGYYVALLHGRIFGQDILNATVGGWSGGEDEQADYFSAYAACAKSWAESEAKMGIEAEVEAEVEAEADIAMLLVNMGNGSVAVSLPSHTTAKLWLLTAPTVLAETMLLNGRPLTASPSGDLPNLDPISPPPTSQPLNIPAFSAVYMILSGTSAGAASCSART